MLLSSQEERDKYRSSGVWQDSRLDQILLGHAQTRPDSLAFIDDPELPAVNGRQPQCLTYIQAAKKILGLCDFLSGIGLKRDTVVAMMLPPSVDGALLVLAASRLGLIIAPLPLTLGETELLERLEDIGAKAVVCTSQYEGDLVGERVRNVAATMFSIRFVFCLGGNVPDGLVDLGPVMDELDDGAEISEQHFDSSEDMADELQSIVWSTANNNPSLPIGRSHNQLLAVARHHISQTGLDADECVLMSHHWSGLAGLGASFAPALLQGARLQFHHFQTYQRLEACMAEYGAQHVMIPAHGWESLHSYLSDQVREQLLSISLVWVRYHTGVEVYRHNETAARLIDVTNFNELALHSQIRREPGQIGGILLGEIGPVQGDGTKTIWLESDLFGLEEAKAQFDASLVGGELCVAGPMVPNVAFPAAGSQEGRSLPSNRKGFIHTDIGCRVTEQTEDQMYFVPLGDLSDILPLGALSVQASELDNLYQSCEGVEDAAAFVRPANHGGNELMVAVVADESYSLDQLQSELRSKSISAHKLPLGLVHVPTIPRQGDGKIHRSGLINQIDDKKVA
jgi:acyl-CoA synthetase (AMP-forming)/AMP-acid ligase II